MSSHKKGIWAWLFGCDLSDSLDLIEGELTPVHKKEEIVKKWGAMGFADPLVADKLWAAAALSKAAVYDQFYTFGCWYTPVLCNAVCCPTIDCTKLEERMVDGTAIQMTCGPLCGPKTPDEGSARFEYGRPDEVVIIASCPGDKHGYASLESDKIMGRIIALCEQNKLPTQFSFPDQPKGKPATEVPLKEFNTLAARLKAAPFNFSKEEYDVKTMQWVTVVVPSSQAAQKNVLDKYQQLLPSFLQTIVDEKADAWAELDRLLDAGSKAEFLERYDDVKLVLQFKGHHGRSWLKEMQKEEQRHQVQLLKFLEQNNRDASVQPVASLTARGLVLETLEEDVAKQEGVKARVKTAGPVDMEKQTRQWEAAERVIKSYSSLRSRDWDKILRQDDLIQEMRHAKSWPDRQKGYHDFVLELMEWQMNYGPSLYRERDKDWLKKKHQPWLPALRIKPSKMEMDVCEAQKPNASPAEQAAWLAEKFPDSGVHALLERVAEKSAGRVIHCPVRFLTDKARSQEPYVGRYPPVDTRSETVANAPKIIVPVKNKETGKMEDAVGDIDFWLGYWTSNVRQAMSSVTNKYWVKKIKVVAITGGGEGCQRERKRLADLSGGGKREQEIAEKTDMLIGCGTCCMTCGTYQCAKACCPGCRSAQYMAEAMAMRFFACADSRKIDVEFVTTTAHDLVRYLDPLDAAYDAPLKCETWDNDAVGMDCCHACSKGAVSLPVSVMEVPAMQAMEAGAPGTAQAAADKAAAVAATAVDDNVAINQSASQTQSAAVAPPNKAAAQVSPSKSSASAAAAGPKTLAKKASDNRVMPFRADDDN